MLDTVKRTSVYQPEQLGLTFPEIPEFKNHEEHRLYLKKRLVAACRAFAQQGFDYGFAGHLTVRDPERPHLYWTNPMAIHFNQVRLSNLILVDHEGRVVEGDYAVNRAGFVPIGRHGRLDAATRACIFAAAGMRRIATARAGKPEPGRRARFALVAQ